MQYKNCKNCNAEISSLASICPRCGNNLTEPNSSSIIFRVDTKEEFNFYISKKFVKKFSIGLICSILALIGLSVLISYYNRPDLTECINLMVEGYNGYAYSSYSINTQALKSQITAKQDANNMSYISSWQLDQIAAQIESSLAKTGKWDHLENGDEFAITITNLQEISNMTGIKFRNNSKISYTVSNLEEPQIISIKDVFSPVFYGAEGAGRVQFFINSDQVPFDVYSQNDKLYINHTLFEYKTSNNEGVLSNNDIFSLSFPESSQAFTDIINEYGYGFVEESVDYIVSGLGNFPVIDLFSHVDVIFYGVSGDAKMDIQWKEENEENIVSGHYKIVRENDIDFNVIFSIYSDLDFDKSLSFKKISQSDNNDGFNYHVGIYAVCGNQMESLTGGQIIDVGIISEDGTIISEDSFNQFGFKISPCLKQETVDGNALSYYVTSVEQVSNDMILQYAISKLPDIKDYLMKNWAYITRGDHTYNLLTDVIIKKCIPNKKAFIGKKYPDDNEYSLWLVYPSVLYDDEMGEDKTVFVIATINSLQLNLAGTEIANYGKPSFDFLLSEQELAVIYEAFDYPENDFHEIQLN